MPLPYTEHYSNTPSPYFKSILKTPNPAFPQVIAAILSFHLTKTLLIQLSPQSAKCQGSTTVWKWVNTANSMVHSVVTGVGAVICIHYHPSMTTNIMYFYSDSTHRLVCYSVGYFIFDFFDMLANHRKRSSYELMLHHVFVLFCFILSITTRHYLSFTIISLTIEVNSIFLHLRQLLLITKTPKTSSPQKITSSLNILTFLLFRISVLTWMIRWMIKHRNEVNPASYALGFASVSVLMVMSLVLLWRLIKADYLAVANKEEEEEDESNDSTHHRNDNNNSSSSNGGVVGSILLSSCSK